MKGLEYQEILEDYLTLKIARKTCLLCYISWIILHSFAYCQQLKQEGHIS